MLKTVRECITTRRLQSEECGPEGKLQDSSLHTAASQEPAQWVGQTSLRQERLESRNQRGKRVDAFGRVWISYVPVGACFDGSTQQGLAQLEVSGKSLFQHNFLCK